MLKKPRRKASCAALRVLDANLNRAFEGLRVCEDLARFVWEDAGLADEGRRLRHGLAAASLVLPYRGLLEARDVRHDPGRSAWSDEKDRRGWPDVWRANLQRAKEALRVLEETSKLADSGVAFKFKRLRYSVYEWEKRKASKSRSLRHFRPRKS